MRVDADELAVVLAQVSTPERRCRPLMPMSRHRRPARVRGSQPIIIGKPGSVDAADGDRPQGGSLGGLVASVGQSGDVRPGLMPPAAGRATPPAATVILGGRRRKYSHVSLAAISARAGSATLLARPW